jgi:hypothetical protein
MAESATQVPPSVRLARRWVVDYFNSHDEAAAREFCAEDYTLHIGSTVFAGRDTQWLPAVRIQMDRFPGLGMTVHQVVASDNRAAVLFTQHGTDGGPGGRVTCWGGIAIYERRGERLSGCVAQEDYTTRQRQLKSGVPDPIVPPAPDPWDTVLRAPDPQAEQMVRDWLEGHWPKAPPVHVDDEHLTGSALAFEVARTHIGQIWSSGQDVVFHARQAGVYQGGFAGVPAGLAGELHVNGIVRVVDGHILSGRVIRDRAGLRAALLAAAA